MKAVFLRKLISPIEAKNMYPLDAKYRLIVNQQIDGIKEILSINSLSKRKLLIIGPCSADNEESVIDYFMHLRELQNQVKDRLLIVPRLYTNKPRTNGDGYKGMLHQPNPVAETDLYNGIIATRRLHIRAIKETGFACADEMLYPENYEYLDDLIAYVAIGARSVENQQHRLTASAVNSPVGMKNPTSGDYKVMLNSIHAAQNSHTFIYRGWEIKSEGNIYTHSILRGYTNKHGESQPNYHYEDLLRLSNIYTEANGYYNPATIVDVNHANSGKQPFEQPHIVMDVINSMRHNSAINNLVKGFMVESYLVDGCQPVNGGTYGQSITDPCLGWDKTERLVLGIANSLD